MPENSPERRLISLFRNGRNQAVRIPRELELPGTQALLYRDGDRLVLEPVATRTLPELLRGWEPLDLPEWPGPGRPDETGRGR